MSLPGSGGARRTVSAGCAVCAPSVATECPAELGTGRQVDSQIQNAHGLVPSPSVPLIVNFSAFLLPLWPHLLGLLSFSPIHPSPPVVLAFSLVHISYPGYMPAPSSRLWIPFNSSALGKGYSKSLWSCIPDNDGVGLCQRLRGLDRESQRHSSGALCGAGQGPGVGRLVERQQGSRPAVRMLGSVLPVAGSGLISTGPNPAPRCHVLYKLLTPGAHGGWDKHFTAPQPTCKAA